MARQPIQTLSLSASNELYTIFSATGAGVLELLFINYIDADKEMYLVIDGVEQTVKITTYSSIVGNAYVDILNNELFLRTLTANPNPDNSTFQNPMKIHFSKTLEVKAYGRVGYSFGAKATYSLYK